MQPSIDLAAKWKDHKFVAPEKRILTPEILLEFPKKKIYNYLMIFISELQSSVLRKKISATPLNPKFESFHNFLVSLEKLIDEVPPLQQPMRFGNKAFVTWHQQASEKADKFFNDHLPSHALGAKVELMAYYNDSFGATVRIDYGTGHELHFLILLYCLGELGIYTREDYESLVRNVFYKYIKLMRKLQSIYMLEPAGSHGVWGLDDYHFLPFVFGAAELIDHEVASTPNTIHDDLILKEFAKDFMYLDCIQFIKNVKKAPLGECSPMLNDISGATSWYKVAGGMIKMFQAEVLGKHPVAKHIFFGSIFSFNQSIVKYIANEGGILRGEYFLKKFKINFIFD